VLAYNLARPGALANGVFERARSRLLLYGAVATIPFVALKAPLAYGWWPLNVLFTLWVGTLVIELLERRRPQRMLVILPLFSFGSMLPEYWHLGTGAMIAAWYLCKHPRVSALVLWMLPLAALVIINHNFYALLVIPPVYAAQFINLPVSRCRHLFYVFYPAHLAALWVVQACMV
jgi:TraX protein